MQRWLFAVLLLALTGCGTGVTETTGVSLSAPPPDGSYNDTDVMFLQMAVPQHEQGIEMARLATERASRADVRNLAAAIEATQSDELAEMKDWLVKWNQPVAYDPDPNAHKGHGGMHGSDPAVLEVLRDTPPGPDFDARFLNLLTGHQHGAVELARMEEKEGRHPDARALAGRIVKSRTAQIQQMGTYLTG
ncbi:DUF305 domain-containing protein [Actinophytocola algeriensis]|uniref:Uncharacterized protein (DUF305 family) n=1 Tax=Actinophytocola algeriensis TaxID=1768010 RepID=A0A7W7Q6D8_9PSEU|nr:DUF305 domain-containing protein [Actinophytocola algeriensis]MBB4907526.1 uncharacterized protein (DUF305 family) [Actinophytocola algeriensis]MBE1479556.1 uncharacterized protein (DUF305 family) [Actinophytocola algeriensis]